MRYLILAALAFIACGDDTSTINTMLGDEESNTQYGVNDTYDETRAGARLILAYDSSANSFQGTVTNTTSSTFSRVRVEVHLSNGIELGPTTPVDLSPGETIDVVLPSSDAQFTTWGAHPEVGSSGAEGNSGGEGSESGHGPGDSD